MYGNPSPPMSLHHGLYEVHLPVTDVDTPLVLRCESSYYRYTVHRYIQPTEEAPSSPR